MRIDYRKELNDEQYKVISEGDGACLVLAGAGSGKTRTITFRVAYLLEKGIPPENILLLTFTNKAAHEMLERVKNLMGANPTGLWSGTFHHIGYKLVSTYASKLGFGNRITILDMEDSRSLLTQVLKDEGFDPKMKKLPPVNAIAELYSYARNAMIPIEEAIDIKRPSAFGAAPDIAHVLAVYEKRKLESGFCDFDDLLCLWLKLIEEHPDVHAKLSSQFNYILVDEYQDTNRVQARIVQKMAAVHGNVLAVGDDAQSIYSFRAADIANILEFEKRYVGARVFNLVTNYRSTPEILAVANHVISQNVNQFKKELLSVLAGHTKPILLKADTAALEAEKIANIIAKHKRGGGKLADIAILFRSTFHSQALEFELTRRGIPYDYRGGTQFFARAHVKDVLSYLRAFVSPKDSIAWHRLLVQQEGIGLESARKIYEQVKRLGSIQDLAHDSTIIEVDKRCMNGWNIVKRTMFELSMKGAASVGERIRTVSTHAYRFYVEKEFENHKERLDDVEQLATYTDKLFDLKDFLAETALQEQFKGKKGLIEDKLVMSTIHQSKGLEWEQVFLIGLIAGSFPNERAALEEGGIEEERRLFYVALTRARKQLFLCYTVLGGPRNEFVVSPSPFLDEIDEILISREDEEGSQVAEVTYEPDGGDWRKKNFLSSINEF